MKKLLAILALLSLTACTNSGTFDVSTSNVTIYGDDALGGTKAFRVDNLTQAAVQLPYEHYELHEGHVYSFCGVSNISGSSNYTILLKTPSTKPVHIQFDVETEGEASFDLFEAVTTSNNGTPQTAINRNRSSNNTAESLVYLTPTLTGTGINLCQRHWGSGKGVGGGAEIAEGWVFKPNTLYVVRITNHTVSAQWASLDMVWYVH